MSVSDEVDLVDCALQLAVRPYIWVELTLQRTGGLPIVRDLECTDLSPGLETMF
jgi:hypothetical protein